MPRWYRRLLPTRCSCSLATLRMSRRTGPLITIPSRCGSVVAPRSFGAGLFATIGLAASAWLVQPRLMGSAGAGSRPVGVVMLVGAHVLACRSTTDHDAWPGIQASVHGFVAYHLGEAAAIEPRWTPAAWMLFGASIVAMFRRPVRRQI